MAYYRIELVRAVGLICYAKHKQSRNTTRWWSRARRRTYQCRCRRRCRGPRSAWPRIERKRSRMVDGKTEARPSSCRGLSSYAEATTPLRPLGSRRTPPPPPAEAGPAGHLPHRERLSSSCCSGQLPGRARDPAASHRCVTWDPSASHRCRLQSRHLP